MTIFKGKPKLIAVILSIAVGVGILIHQAVISKKFFEVEQFLHHESFAIALIIFGLGLALG